MTDDEHAAFTISSIAKMLQVHPQTLRFYERSGLVKPGRTRGDNRLYSAQDIEQLRLVLHLTRDLGVNTAGVEIILRMQRQLEALEQELSHLRQVLAERVQQEQVPQVPTQALTRATPRKLVKLMPPPAAPEAAPGH
ncbi:MAG: MerR family transcriptional regulator [Candidatus Tectimicrobiota bacterium]